MAKKTIKNPSDVKLINMKDEREELDFLNMRLSKNPTENPTALSQTDVNSATVSQLKQLFYINDVSIQKIIKYKEEGGVFYSQDEFFELIDLKPHERVALMPYILADGGISAKTPGERPKKRRIIDY